MSIFVFRAILVVLLHPGCSEVVQRSALFDTKENLKVDVGAMIKRQTTRSLTSCTQECLSEPLCTSFNYDGKASQGVCELYEEGNEMKLNHEPGWLCGHLLQRKKVVKHFHFTFTTLGAQGPTGPTNTSEYQGTTLQGKVSLDNGIQIWQVPLNGSYAIEAWGASGARGRESDEVSAVTKPGGKGAYMKGTFNLARGTSLKILVGQAGSHGTLGSSLPGGGGGGTFITFSSNAALIVAGGGGGGGGTPGNYHEGDPGQITEEGSQSGGSNGTGGKIIVNGSPSNSFESGAGGGLIGDGDSGVVARGGKSFANGGEGGDSLNGGKGGFGGGGGALLFQGAGGGYSGGGVTEYHRKKTIAGGGGSFNSGESPIKKEGVKEGDGKVIITLVDPELQQN